MNIDHVQQLRQWIDKGETNHGSISKLRGVLGEIMESLNNASALFKSASRAPRPEHASMLQQTLVDVEHYNEILALLPRIKQIIAQDNTANERLILGIIHTMERMRFSTQQVERLRQMAQSLGTGMDFPEEINEEGFKNLMSNSLYNTVNDSQKTLKVVREVLQNAVDATDPKQHPTLKERQDYSPEIHILYRLYGVDKPDGQTDYFIDLMFEDKGIGMNWDVLSKKFFVQFSSGKNDQTGAAGGFGIAKSLIQDTPRHGWSVDTEGIHSSRFHKNLHFGSRAGEYSPPNSDIKKTADGTVLTLYGLPFASNGEIEKLCKHYAINGMVKIFLDKKEIKPVFTMDSLDIQPLNADKIPEIVATEDSEKESAARIYSSFKDKISEKIKEVGGVSTELTKYKLYLKKSDPTNYGRLYVMVNGHYQFDKTISISGLDVVCSIETKARPGSADYPLDPGREYLRGGMPAKINELVSIVDDYLRRLKTDDLFKEGLETLTVNEDAQPMEIKNEPERQLEKEEKLMTNIMGVVGASAFKRSESDDEYEDPEGVTHIGGVPKDEKEAEDDSDQDGEEKEIRRPPVSVSEEQIEKTASDLAEIAGNTSVFSKEAIASMIKEAVKTKNEIERNRRIETIVKGLSTPGQIIIQKNFLAKDIISQNSHLVAEILILWQKTINLIAEKLNRSSHLRIPGELTYIPGLIFTDKALGLFMPRKPDLGLKYDSVSINPVTLSALIHPELFQERVAGDSYEKEAFDFLGEKKTEEDDDTPINRVAKFIFHLATHEMCHLFYPDTKYSQNENFHRMITKVELVCHDVYEEVKREVKTMMPSLRKSARKLITLIKHSKISKGKIREWTKVGFWDWASRKPRSRPATIFEFKEEPQKSKPNINNLGFKEFLTLSESAESNWDAFYSSLK